MMSRFERVFIEASKEIHRTLQTSSNQVLETTNATSDIQNSLDLKANEICKDLLLKRRDIQMLISEEEDEAIVMDEDAKYIVAFDPLDGSFNLDNNLPLGSIFAVYENSLDKKNLIFSFYALYGTKLIYAFSDGKESQFYENGIRIDVKNLDYYAGIVSIGGNFFATPFRYEIEDLYQRGAKNRYMGCFVADMHSIFVKGSGIFGYIGKDKLRLFYEIYPYELFMRSLDGEMVAFTEDKKKKESVHKRGQFFVGSKGDIKAFKAIIKDKYMEL